MAEIAKVGVIGAGLMGNGIAHVSALAGLPVVLMDVQQAALDKAMATMSGNMDRQVKKAIITAADKDAALGRITTVTTNDAFGDCDIVIEAATENEDLKKKIYAGLLPKLKADAILASNTSSIPITRLAAATDRPARFIGMHFFNPVPMMQLVELIRALQTADATYETVKALTLKVGKTPVEVRNSPGFVANRILLPMLNEAVFCLYEGLAKPEDIDTVMKLGMAHPMGPLALADLIGLDTCLSILQVLYDGFKDPKYRPCPLWREMVDAGRLGRKSGRGFFDYTKA
jgi:3-hydroxybutyryl-CoA dehydrogenase